jgi:serine protease AprX
MDSIKINGNQNASGPGVLAFTDGPEIVDSFAEAAPSVKESDYILIQTTGPLETDQLQALKDKSVEILAYKGNNVYLCGYKEKTFAPITEDLKDFVTHAEVFHPGYVVEPGLKSGDLEIEAKVNISLHNNVDNESLERITNEIANIANVPTSDLEVKDGIISLTVSKDKLPQLAKIDEVVAMNEVCEPHLLNSVASKIVEAHVPVGENGTIFRGKGQIVCVADTGFDTGDPEACHEAFEDRVVKLFPLGKNRAGKSDDPDGHGTHVCGTVVGRGHMKGELIESPASQASLIVQSVFSGFTQVRDNPPVWQASLSGLDIGYQRLFDDAFIAGARIHTNSWGGASRNGPNAYDSNVAGEIDKYIRNNQELVVLFAAGNEGQDLDSNKGRVDESSLTLEAHAKNWYVSADIVGSFQNSFKLQSSTVMLQ